METVVVNGEEFDAFRKLTHFFQILKTVVATSTAKYMHIVCLILKQNFKLLWHSYRTTATAAFCRICCNVSTYRHRIKQNESVFSFLRQLSTWHCSRLLLSAGRAAIDRYLLTAGPTAANPHQRSAAGKRLNRRTDRRTDGRTPDRYVGRSHLRSANAWPAVCCAHTDNLRRQEFCCQWTSRVEQFTCGTAAVST